MAVEERNVCRNIVPQTLIKSDNSISVRLHVSACNLNDSADLVYESGEVQACKYVAASRCAGLARFSEM